MFLMKNTAGQFIYFTVFDWDTHKNLEGQLSNLHFDLSKDGGTQTAPGGDVTELGNGQYCVELLAEDTDCDTLGLTISYADQTSTPTFEPVQFSIHTLTSGGGGGMDLTTVFDTGGATVGQLFQVLAAILSGKLQTVGPVSLFQNWAGTKNRVTVESLPGGNRTTITFDFS